jgi:hypothetical protein
MSISRRLAGVLACLVLFSVSVVSSAVAQAPVQSEVGARSGWSIETVDSAVGGSSSITLDSGDNPHISYYDNWRGDLKHARWTGSVWSIETVDSDGNVGYDTSIALDSSDSPHISYSDYNKGDLKYAHGDLRTPTILKSTISPSHAYPGEYVTFSGVLTPAVANERVFLFSRINKWNFFAMRDTDQQGRYYFEFRIPELVETPVTVSFVAFFPGTDYHIGDVSLIEKLSITSGP